MPLVIHYNLMQVPRSCVQRPSDSVRSTTSSVLQQRLSLYNMSMHLVQESLLQLVMPAYEYDMIVSTTGAMPTIHLQRTQLASNPSFRQAIA